MSNDLRTKSFMHGPYLVRYLRDVTGDYIITIETNGVSVPGRYILFNIDETAKELVENVRAGGIGITVDDAREILRKVQAGYDEGVAGKTTVVVGDHALDVYLPHDGGCDGGKCNAPPWAKDLEVRNFEEPDGGGSIITHTHEDNQYVVVAMKSEGDGEPKYSLIAVLPRFMGRVYDPFYNEPSTPFREIPWAWAPLAFTSPGTFYSL